MGNIKPILSRYERRAHELILASLPSGFTVTVKQPLFETLSERGVRSKKRLEAIKTADKSGLNFDFVVWHNGQACLAIEFDGPDHFSTSDVVYDDMLKKQFCDVSLLSLMKIDTQYLRLIGDKPVFVWLLEQFFSRHYYAETNLDNKLGVRTGTTGSQTVQLMPQAFTVDPFLRLRASFKLLLELDGFTVETVSLQTEDGYDVAHTFVQLDADTFVIGVGAAYLTRCLPVDPVRLASDLSLLDAADLLGLFNEERYAGVTGKDAREWRRYLIEHVHEAGLGRILSVMPICEQLAESWL